MSLRRAVVSDGGEELQTDRVFPERRLPGPLKQTGVCEGLLGEVVSSTISSLPGRFFSSYFLSRLFSPVSSVPLFSHSFSRYLKDDIKSQMLPSMKSELE